MHQSFKIVLFLVSFFGGTLVLVGQTKVTAEDIFNCGGYSNENTFWKVLDTIPIGGRRNNNNLLVTHLEKILETEDLEKLKEKEKSTIELFCKNRNEKKCDLLKNENTFIFGNDDIDFELKKLKISCSITKFIIQDYIDKPKQLSKENRPDTYNKKTYEYYKNIQISSLKEIDPTSKNISTETNKEVKSITDSVVNKDPIEKTPITSNKKTPKKNENMAIGYVLFFGWLILLIGAFYFLWIRLEDTDKNKVKEILNKVKKAIKHTTNKIIEQMENNANGKQGISGSSSAIIESKSEMNEKVKRVDDRLKKLENAFSFFKEEKIKPELDKDFINSIAENYLTKKRFDNEIGILVKKLKDESDEKRNTLLEAFNKFKGKVEELKIKERFFNLNKKIDDATKLIPEKTKGSTSILSRTFNEAELNKLIQKQIKRTGIAGKEEFRNLVKEYTPKPELPKQAIIDLIQKELGSNLSLKQGKDEPQFKNLIRRIEKAEFDAKSALEQQNTPQILSETQLKAFIRRIESAESKVKEISNKEVVLPKTTENQLKNLSRKLEVLEEKVSNGVVSSTGVNSDEKLNKLIAKIANTEKKIESFTKKQEQPKLEDKQLTALVAKIADAEKKIESLTEKQEQPKLENKQLTDLVAKIADAEKRIESLMKKQEQPKVEDKQITALVVKIADAEKKIESLTKKQEQPKLEDKQLTALVAKIADAEKKIESLTKKQEQPKLEDKQLTDLVVKIADAEKKIESLTKKQEQSKLEDKQITDLVVKIADAEKKIESLTKKQEQPKLEDKQLTDLVAKIADAEKKIESLTKKQEQPKLENKQLTALVAKIADAEKKIESLTKKQEQPKLENKQLTALVAKIADAEKRIESLTKKQEQPKLEDKQLTDLVEKLADAEKEIINLSLKQKNASAIDEKEFKSLLNKYSLRVIGEEGNINDKLKKLIQTEVRAKTIEEHKIIGIAKREADKVFDDSYTREYIEGIVKSIFKTDKVLTVKNERNNTSTFSTPPKKLTSPSIKQSTFESNYSGKLLYSPAPTPAGYFIGRHIKEEYEKARSIYQIIPNGSDPESATYTISQRSIDMALSIPDSYLIPGCELDNKTESKPSKENLGAIVPGKLKKENNNWKIVKKAKISFQ